MPGPQESNLIFVETRLAASWETGQAPSLQGRTSPHKKMKPGG
jgi:hypothetical protein